MRTEGLEGSRGKQKTSKTGVNTVQKKKNIKQLQPKQWLCLEKDKPTANLVVARYHSPADSECSSSTADEKRGSYTTSSEMLERNSWSGNILFQLGSSQDNAAECRLHCTVHQAPRSKSRGCGPTTRAIPPEGCRLQAAASGSLSQPL